MKGIEQCATLTYITENKAERHPPKYKTPPDTTSPSCSCTTRKHK